MSKLAPKLTFLILICALLSTAFAQTALYNVVANDTLFSIAKRYGTTVTELQRINALHSDTLKLGQTLYVPQNAALSAAAPAAASPAPTSGTTRVGLETYLVNGGDTLLSLSERFGVSTLTLERCNPEYDFASEDAYLTAGISLTIPPGEGAIVRLPENKTLLHLAIDHHLSVAALAAANNITSFKALSVGSVVYIPDPDVVEEFVAEAVVPQHSDTNFIWPIHGQITSYYGYRNISVGGNTFHGGVDIGAALGTPIQASKSGTVSRSGWGGSYGYVVYVDHPDGSQTRYAHMSSIGVSVGQVVSQGDMLGLVGTTGASTGPHLHFEIRYGGNSIDPLTYLQVVQAGQ
ncbi:MAG: peptidoglycan DD-metalloendopeptidase family protein [Trueperaceae bacterium]|nr:peptidoglycan DD-metalloendopeptidase family protein [Trueperaceae bacterium]